VCLSQTLSRSSLKPALDKGKKGGKKRAYTEDDELDPMDPSSYSDAPRGGWYVWVHILVFIFRTYQMHLLNYGVLGIEGGRE